MTYFEYLGKNPHETFKEFWSQGTIQKRNSSLLLLTLFKVLVNFDERLTWYPSETNDCELQLNDSSTGIKTVYVLLYGALFEMEEFNVS